MAWLPAIVLPSFIAGALGNWAARQGNLNANFKVLLVLYPLTAATIFLLPLAATPKQAIIFMH